MEEKGWFVVLPGLPGTGDLPLGLSLDQKTGIISGTPEEFGTFKVTIKVVNDCGEDTQIKIIEVCGPPDIVGDDTFYFKVGEEKTIQLEFEGSPPTFEPEPEPEKYLVTFTITDGLYNPITDAIIECKDEEDNLFTIINNNDGTYEVELFNNNYNYNVSKIGYLTKNSDFVVSDCNININILLVQDFESIIHIIDSSSGTFIVPTRGYSIGQSVFYNWIIDGSLDGVNYTPIQNTSGTGSYDSGITLSIPVGLRSTDMYLRIRPNGVVNYAWARAFGFGDYNITSGAGASINRSKVKRADISSCQKGFRLDNTNSLGNNFLYDVWSGCTSLLTVMLPDTSNWNVTSIGYNFLYYTWHNCTSLETAVVPDTSNWSVTTLNGFLTGTWNGCTLLKTAVVPDTSNWNISTIEYGFLTSTWTGCTSLVNVVVPDTNNWVVTSIGNGGFLTGTWTDCTSLKSAVVPNTTNWVVTGSIGNEFLSGTWYNCSKLETAVVPDTSNWNVTGSIGNGFLSGTWYNCSKLETMIVPDTSNWNVAGSIGNGFLSGTWHTCTSLETAVLPDTSNWNITTIDYNFLIGTWTFSVFGSRTLTIMDNIIANKSVYTGIIRALETNSAGIDDSKIDQIKVPASLVSTFQSSPSWSNITSSKFVAI